MKFYSIFLFILILSSCSNKYEISPKRQDIQALVFASGQLEWDGDYQLSAQTDGELFDYNLEVGQQVGRGQVIGTIQNPNNIINQQTAQEQFEIAQFNTSKNSPQLQQIKENISFAKQKYKHDLAIAQKYQRLLASGSVSKLESDNYSLTAENSKTTLESLQKQYDNAIQQANLQVIQSRGQLRNQATFAQYNTIRAIEAGTVIQVLKSKGDFVRKGEIIAKIANSNQIKTVLNIDENSISKVKVGQMVYIRLNTQKDKTYRGKISEIEAAFDSKSQSFIANAVFDQLPPQNLYGTQLEANIDIGTKKNALTIPKKYLSYGNLVKIKGKKEPQKVKVGIQGTEIVEILEGIDEKTVLEPFKP